MTCLRFKAGDTVVYTGNNNQAKGKVGRIINTKNDVSQGAQFYPKTGYDFTVKFKKFGLISFVLDVAEKELESIEW